MSHTMRTQEMDDAAPDVLEGTDDAMGNINL